MRTVSRRLHPLRQRILSAIGLLIGLALVLGACGSESSDPSGGGSLPSISPSTANSAGDAPSGAAASFTNGVFSTHDVKVQITRYKVIQPGQRGNESGDGPVIAFWYRTTNLSGARVDPTLAWILNLDAYQGNDSNAENKLTIAAPPDDRLRHNQTTSIAKGRTVENAFAYELDDLVTPVDLVATDSLNAPIGKTEYEVR